MIVAVIVCVVIAVVIPAFYRSYQGVRNRPLLAALTRIQGKEDSAFSAQRHYITSLLPLSLFDSLPRGVAVEQLSTDSAGWGAIVVDSVRGRRCGGFDGGDQFRPSANVGRPRAFNCW